MRVAPGYAIPLWLKLWDGKPNRYILAHVTDVAGVEQFGSPVALSYSGNRGIYSGSGPMMASEILFIDYQTFLDSAHTQLDNSYLPASDLAEPITTDPTSQVIFLTVPVKGQVSAPKIVGHVVLDVEAQGKIKDHKLIGFVNTPKLIGRVSTPEIEENL